MRGGIIFDALLAEMRSILGIALQEYLAAFPNPGGQAAINQTFQINGINGVWGGYSDNLVTFNASYKAGKSLEESAWSTFTGKQCKEKMGYEKVTIKDLDPDVQKDPKKIPQAKASGFKKATCTFEP